MHALPAHVWDETLRDIAAFRVRHHIADNTHGLGPITDDADHNDRRAQLSERIDATRIWLATYQTSPELEVVRTRSTIELTARQAELDLLLETVPDDQRDFIATLRADGQLPFDDTAALLTEALADQGIRRDWILAHWPHIVEYAEITRALEQGAAGPDTAKHVQTLTAVADSAVAAAAANDERWLHSVLSALVPPDSDTVDDATRVALAEIAAYRQRWQITHPDPLGVAASTVHQAAERAEVAAVLAEALRSSTAVENQLAPSLVEEAHQPAPIDQASLEVHESPLGL